MAVALSTDDPVQKALSDLAQELQKKIPREIDLGLHRVEKLLAKLGSPQAKLPPVVHVAGTNGKGSVIAFLRAMLEAAGWRVHVYTSPHLVRFNERIRVAANLVDDDALMGAIKEAMAQNKDEPITFFELTTVAAFKLFAENPADIVLLETGMGGRLDATNVVKNPIATVITPVSFDHKEYLGDTIAKIAAEKAAIQKSGAAAIIGPQQAEAMEVIANEALRVGATPYRCGTEWWAFTAGDRINYRSQQQTLSLPMPRLKGAHQVDNAATAIAAIENLKNFTVRTEAIHRGLLTAEWPARMQQLRAGPLVSRLPKGWEIWLDGGHNPGAGVVIAEVLRGWRDKPCFLLIGMLSNKESAEFLEPMAGLVQAVRAVGIEGEPKSQTATILSEIARRKGFDALPSTGLGAAVEEMTKLTQEPARILICGSLYLAGRVLKDHQ